MKSPRKFYEPLAIGAPQPYRDLPVRVERMIHFVPAHLEKVRAKAGDMAKTVDVILGNLEDAIPADAEGAALTRVAIEAVADRSVKVIRWHLPDEAKSAAPWA